MTQKDAPSHPQVHYTRIDRIGAVERGQYQVRCRCGYISRYFDTKREAEDDESDHARTPPEHD